MTRVSRRLRPVLVLLLASVLAGCGTLVDMGKDRPVERRRIFLNDPAANDSLPATLVTNGLSVVLRPGKNYRLSFRAASPDAQLDFYVRSEGGYTFQKTIDPESSGTLRSFLLQPTRSTADFYVVFLRAPGGGMAVPPDSIRLVPADTALSSTLAVRLHMVRQLTGLPGDSAKAAYAQAFNVKLREVYAAQGILVDTSTSIVEPDAPPLAVDFGAAGVTLPGTRRSGAVNIYLVDDITSNLEGATVLGFAPREALDLSTSGESRVVLNVRGGSASAMAVTAAHEIGHFLGLRHTSATEQDRGFDRDESNRDDGFASTPFCSALLKRPAGMTEIVLDGPDGMPYCLRVTGSQTDCGCSLEERRNLMYPYRCPGVTQETIGDDQARFIQSNLRAFQ